ncbi:Alpha/Beta hydrolase protein [Flagelloscypha sp. PMI_526]|nr:Alpha/Beta hydrolase protein [Flagelloscypha sp. PMI_526]
MFSIFLSASLLGGVLACTLPVVDVGYARYLAANLTDKDYYTFSNIRYAAPPVGSLRWRAPQPPLINRSSIIQISPERNVICPQSSPAWFNNASIFLKDNLGPFAPQLDAGPLLLDPSQPTPDLDPRTSEDCLVLDVFAPKHLFHHYHHAPVLVWIHGGGYTARSKDAFFFTPEGMYNVSYPGFVAVSINYRLGAFGFLAGSIVKKQGVLNAGLLDQRFALEWVRTHISKFGGDPSRVTIMGESAGGGSVMHQITARLFLNYLKVKSLDEARRASYNDIIRANLLLIGNASPHSSFPVLPVADGSFIPAPPAKLLASGRYAHGLRIMTGHNLDEGLMFTNPIAADEASYLQSLHELFPSATDYAFRELFAFYPSTFDGSLPYTSQLTPSAKEHAASFAYLFTAYPGLHAQDLPYAFYTPDSPLAGGVANVSIARAYQKGLASFILTGSPDFGTGPLRPYGKKGNTLVISNSTIPRVSSGRDTDTI